MRYVEVLVHLSRVNLMADALSNEELTDYCKNNLSEGFTALSNDVATLTDKVQELEKKIEALGG